MRAVVAAVALVVATGGHASAGPSPVSVSRTCFVVHNPGGAATRGAPALPADPVARSVIGRRFTTRASSPDRVIVLVHGHSWWENEWDLKPDFSIARNLAREGFTVVSYDRLGNGESDYPLPLRETLTFPGQRRMLHEVVEQVRGISVLRRGDVEPCPRARAAGRRHAKVILVGHSQGAMLVNGYPGAYGPSDPGHVDALLEDGNGGCSATAACPVPGLGLRATAIVTKKLAANAGRDFSLGFTDVAYDPYLSWQPKVKVIDPVSCTDDMFGMLWPTATKAEALVDEPCNPANEETVPYNEFVSASALRDDLHAVDRRLPVLLTFAEHDGLRPDRGNQDAAPCGEAGCRQPLVDQWRLQCRCGAHVTTWTLPRAGHSIALDRTMPLFTATVARWLRRQGLG